MYKTKDDTKVNCIIMSSLTRVEWAVHMVHLQTNQKAITFPKVKHVYIISHTFDIVNGGSIAIH